MGGSLERVPQQKTREHMKGLFVIGILFVSLGAGCVRGVPIAWPNGEVIHPVLARTPSEHAQGLSGKKTIGDGMLFCFDTSEQRTFWMLDMRIPLDMIWLQGEQVVDISRDVPVAEQGTWARRMSVAPANRVLEVDAGWAARRGLAVGDVFSGIDGACAL